MWISQSEYNDLISENRKLKAQVMALDLLEEAIKRANQDHGACVGGSYVVLSLDAWHELGQQRTADRDTIMKLTAEKDWYKQKYGELLIQSKKGASDT